MFVRIATAVLSFLTSILFIVSAAHAQEWDGVFGLGTDDDVHALAEGPSGEIYAGGDFTRAGTLEAGRIAVWTGEAWEAIGHLDGAVLALAVDGTDLYVGGNFTEITTLGGSVIEADRVAHYDVATGTWSAMGAGFQGGSVQALEVSSGGTLYAGGCFTRSGTDSEDEPRDVNRVARWTGSDWARFVTGTDDHEFTGLPNGCVHALHYDDGEAQLYVGGSFREARIYDSGYDGSDGYRATPVGGLATWSGGSWGMVGGGVYHRPTSDLVAGSVYVIKRDPASGRLYVGGTFDTALNDELVDASDRAANNPVDAYYLTYWDGASWHAEPSLDYARPLSSLSRKTVRDLVFDGDRVYVFGSLRGEIRPHEQDPFDAGGLAVWDSSQELFLVDEDGNSVMGGGAWSRGPSIVDQPSAVYAALAVGDDIYLGGPFNAMLDGTNVAQGYEADHVARWDGETYHALGFGVDEAQINVIHAVDDVLYLGGRFRRAYNGSTTHEASLIVGYDVEANDFVTLGSGISRSGTPNAEVLAIEDDPTTGDLYVGGNFIYGTHPDHDDVSSRSLLRWSGHRWHHVVELYGSNQFDPQVNALERVGDQLYAGGHFSSIPDRDEHQRNLAQLDLNTGAFVPIDFPEDLELTERTIVDLAADDDYLYFLINIYDRDDVRTGSLFRKHLTTGEVESLNGITRGNSASTTNYGLTVDGDFVYLHGSYFNLRRQTAAGDIEEISPVTNLLIVHPETDTWFQAPDGLFPSNTIRDLVKAGATAYVANNALDDLERGRRIDLGTRQSLAIGDGLDTTPLTLHRSDETLWAGGTMTRPSRRLVKTDFVTADPAPVALATINRSGVSLRTGGSDEILLPIANIGDAPLDWSISIDYEPVDDFPAEEGWAAASTASGTAAGGTAATPSIQLDMDEVPTGRYRAVMTVTTNDPEAAEFEFTLDVTVNALAAATNPSPADDASDISIDGDLAWSLDAHAETITVYLGTDPDLTDDDIVYQGDPVEALGSDAIDGTLAYYTTYYWRVDQHNAVSEVEGDVWSFTTALDPDEGVWTLVETELTDYFQAVHVADAQRGWLMTYETVFSTTDGGATWTAHEIADADLLAMAFADHQHGWAVGYDGGVFATSDGGATWTPQSTEHDGTLRGVHFADAVTGWAVGDSGTILHTADGGDTWEEQTSGVSTALYDVYFVDEHTGWAVGSSGTILHTTDGGATWNEQTSGTSTTLNALHAVNASNGWIVTSGGEVLRTADGGSTWTEHESASGHSMYDVHFVDEEVGWIVGGNYQGGTIERTDDGGLTWSTRPSDAEARIRSVHFAGEDVGWAAGDEGTILRYGTDAAPAGPPALALSDDALTANLSAQRSTTRELTIENQGESALDVALSIEAASGDASPTWLSVEPDELLLAAGNETAVTVGFDAEGLATGDYEAVLRLTTNDPDNEQVEIPVDLTVKALEVNNEHIVFADATPSATEIYAGGLLAVRTTAENTGDDATAYAAPLIVNDDTVRVAIRELEAGASETVTFYHPIITPGEYEIAIGNAQIATVTAVEAWAQYNFDASNTGVPRAAEGPAGSVKAAWHVPIDAWMRSSPVVVNGVVFFGANDDHVYAVDASSGEALWHFETGGSVYATPAVVADTLYVPSVDGKLYALDVASGDEYWQLDLGEEIRSSPVVVGGVIYVAGFTHEGSSIYAIEAATQEVLWSYPTEAGVFATPAVSPEGILYVGSNDHHVYALRIGSEEMTHEERLLWSFDAGQPVTASPAAAHGTVYVGSDQLVGNGTFYALDADDGRERWSFDVAGGVPASAAVTDSLLYVPGGDGAIHARFVDSGEEAWTTEIESEFGDSFIGHSSPAAAGDRVYFGTTAGTGGTRRVMALDAATGTIDWAFETHNVHTSPAVIGGRLYIGADGQGMYALVADTDVSTEEETIVEAFGLSQNYPNPFGASTTTIEYQVPQRSDVRLEVFDLLGRRVTVLVNGTVDAGRHRVDLDGSDLASGVYVYRMTADGFTETRQMMVVQ